MMNFQFFDGDFKLLTSFSHDLRVGEFLCETYFMYELAKFIRNTGWYNNLNNFFELFIRYTHDKKRQHAWVHFYIIVNGIRPFRILYANIENICREKYESIYFAKFIPRAYPNFQYPEPNMAEHSIENEKLDDVIQVAKEYDLVRVMYCLSKKNLALEFMF